MPHKPAAKFKRVITWEVVAADPDADFQAVIKQIQGIKIDGVNWVGIPSVVPHVFGLSKIVITSDVVCEEDRNDEIMAALEKLSTEDLDITGEVVNVDFQEMAITQADIDHANALNAAEAAEDAAAAAAEAAAAEEEWDESTPPSKPPAKYARVVTWEVVPADADLDFEACIKQVQAIKVPDVEWLGGANVQPHVFGLSKLVMTSKITSDDDRSDDIKLAIEKLTTDEVEWSAEIVNVDFQEMATPKKKLSELDQLKADLEAEKKKGVAKDKEIADLKKQIAAVKGGGGGGDAKGGKGKGKGDAKPKDETPLPAGMDRKLFAKCQQDGTAKAKDFKKMSAEAGNKFFCGFVDAPEGNFEGLKAATAAAAKSAPELGFILCSKGVEALAVTVTVPASETGKVDRTAWITSAMESIGGMSVCAINDTLADGTIALSIKQDGSKGLFPIKMQDEVIGSGFQFLREKGLLNEDDEDESMDVNMLGEC